LEVRLSYVATIGLECHAQLDTRTKMFCGCAVDADAPPNTRVCPICLGHPGTLPRINAAAVDLGLRAGLALGCVLDRSSVFARKHYYYPDLPKGYQITQYDRPLAVDGAVHVQIDGERRRYALTRIHLEEDAGRMHHAPEGTGVDWNRAGLPLIEIVGAPDLHTPEEAERWLRTVHRVIVEAGICRGDLEKGHFRCDANVSVAPPGAPPGTRVEIKNINSFRFVARALRYEIDRQTTLLTEGGRVEQETRTWTGRGTASLRKKEGLADYRYFSEPDLPPLVLDDREIAQAHAALPGVPLDAWLLDQDAARLADFQARYGIGPREAAVLLADPEITGFYEATLASGGEPRAMATWIMGELLRALNQSDTPLSASRLLPTHVVALEARVHAGSLPRATARALFDELFREGGDVEAMVAARGLDALADTGAVEEAVRRVLDAHPDEVARYHGGRKNLTGFFVGQVVRALGGKVDARVVQQAVCRALDVA